MPSTRGLNLERDGLEVLHSQESMRIHLPLHPEHFEAPKAGPSSSPLLQIGGDLVVVELQGELGWEGDKSGGVVGVIGLDRPDKPTLHLGEHHLLHGKMSTLQKPYAVIRRVVGDPSDLGGSAVAMEGDADEEEDEEDAEAQAGAEASTTPHRSNGTSGTNGTNRAAKRDADDEEEEDPPLFPPSSPPIPVTPAGKHVASSSSPWVPSSTVKDYSSELDVSSPPRSISSKRDRSDEDEDETEEERRKRLKMEKKREERRARRPERTRFYEVVGVVRKKVVFALRPEPIVTATILPD